MSKGLRSRFWLVWSPQGGPPTYQHATKRLARREAARLAAENPSKEFFVLKTVLLVEGHVSISRKPLGPALDLGDEVPF